jgi:hypothetical protein
MDEQPMPPPEPVAAPEPLKDANGHAPAPPHETYEQVVQTTINAIMRTLPGNCAVDHRRELAVQLRFLEAQHNQALALLRTTTVNCSLLAAQFTAIANVAEEMFKIMFQGVQDESQRPLWGPTFGGAKVQQFLALRATMLEVAEKSRLLVPAGNG